jgi:hypothetical protein
MNLEKQGMQVWAEFSWLKVRSSARQALLNIVMN